MSGSDPTTADADSSSDGITAQLDAVDERIDALETARERRDTVEERIEEVGEDAVVDAADAYRRAVRLLDRYEDSATGTGDFRAYVEFQDKFLGLVEGLGESIPAHDAFEAAAERMDQRRLSDADFERAREDLAPAAEYVDLLDRREDATERLSKARRDANLHLDEIDAEIDARTEMLSFADVDLDAPVDALREPIRAYDEAVTAQFESFYESAPIADVVSFLKRAESFPLVDFRPPPRDLRSFVRESPDADEPIPTLLEYAEFTGSKLDHYAEDPAALQTNVAVHRTYLERLSAEPLTVSLPPPPAGELRPWAGEAISLLGRFATPETIARLRTVRDLTRRDDYAELRLAARAHEELDADELERVRSGAAATELQRLRDARNRLSEALKGDTSSSGRGDSDTSDGAG
ncbi:MAG: hypothetical protein ABEI27_03015 [Halobellus sp.]|uniref:DUF7118 family protein n=1 Tax=Halobellus sp. TaxID=1979212 RepID=UPI0035D47280